jgi:hypothetical protein
MGVRVNEAWGDHHSACIDALCVSIALPHIEAHSHDAIALDYNIPNRRLSQAPVKDRAAGNDGGLQGRIGRCADQQNGGSGNSQWGAQVHEALSK